MNSTLQSGVDSSITSDPYKIYQLQLIRRYCPEAPLSLEVGRNLSALGYSLNAWREATARSIDIEVLARYWDSFLNKDKAEASRHLNQYICQYFGEAEKRMRFAMEAEDREAGLLLEEVW